MASTIHTRHLLGYTFLVSLAVYHVYSLIVREGWGRGSYHALSFDRFGTCKSPCQYCQQTSNLVDITMTSFGGVGRTGNYIKCLMHAIDLAVSCKKSLAMPRTDDRGKAFIINNSCHILDFSKRIGPENIFCQNVSFPISGNAHFFWSNRDIAKLKEDTRENYSLAKSHVLLQPCLQQYLGFCDNRYCRFHSMHPLNRYPRATLVAHLREGDIFKSNFSSNVHAGYGQPPLSYYLQAIHYKNWRSILVVTQPGNVGPIRSALMVLNQTLQPPIDLQMSSSWYDDLRTLLCAPALITSKSSLERVFDLGFAMQIFGYRCLGTSRVGRDYFRIPIDSYRPFSKHTNSPTEWIQMLLHSSPQPERC